MISSVIAAVFAVAYLVVTVWLCRGVKLDTRALCLGGVVCALTLVLATIRIPLPTGSNITCGSWIPLMLLALVYDHRLAMLTGWVCGMAVAVALRCWGHVLSGVIFYSQNAWDGWGAWGYSLVYNSSRLVEGILSIVIVTALPLGIMRRAMVKKGGVA